MISRYIKPVIGMAASVCLIFNQGGTVAWVFVVTGIIFVIEGILNSHGLYKEIKLDKKPFLLTLTERVNKNGFYQHTS